MIDLTPLDVRKKHGDFKKILRGYDPQEVEGFLGLVSERLEEVIRENIQLRERSESLQEQVNSQTGREQAVQEALVTAQELRSEMKIHAERQADLIIGEAQAEARRQLAEAEAEIRTRFRDAERRLEQAQDALAEMERRRTRFLRSFRQLLDREMDVVQVEENRPPLEERPIDLDLGGGTPPPVAETERATEDRPLAGGGSETPDAGVAAGPRSDDDDDDPSDVPPPDASIEALAADFRNAGQDLFGAVTDRHDLFSDSGNQDNDDEDDHRA